MCYFIVFAVESTQANRILRGRPGRGLDVFTVNIAWQAETYIKQPHVFGLTDGHCACSLYRPARSPAVRSSDPESMRRKFAKKGWSPAKVDRVIQQKLRNRPDRDIFVGFAPAVCDALSRFTSEIGRIEVQVGWFTGALDGETLSATTLQSMPADRLVGFDLREKERIRVEPTSC